MKKLIDFIDQHSLLPILMSLVIAIAVTYADYVTGSEMAFSLFYLVPIILSVWFNGIITGLVFAIACATLWAVADIYGGRVYSENWIPYWNTVIRLSVFLFTAYLIHKIQNLLTKETKFATTDALTSLYNRRYFLILLESEYKRSKRYGSAFTLAYIDLDNFKLVNDDLGHEVGDELLIKVGNVLKTHTRNTDVTARLGGDEFAVLLTSTTGEAVLQVLEKLKAALLTAMTENNWPVTFSIGAVTFNNLELTTNELLSMTDKLMYRIKKSSKNGIAHETY